MSIAALSSLALNITTDTLVGEAVQTATVTRPGSRGPYNSATGGYDAVPPQTIKGRAVFESADANDILPEGSGGSGDMVLYLFEATGIPREGETIVSAGRSYTIVSTPADEGGLGGVMLKMIVRRV